MISLAQTELPEFPTGIFPTEVTALDGIVAATIFVTSVVIGLVVTRLVVRGFVRAGAAEGLGRLIGRGVAYVIVLFGLFYALAGLEVRVGPLIGALGIGGLVLGLAMQDTLVNAISGIVLQLRRPFRVGDQIVTNEYEGRVHDVNLRVVLLQTFDGEDVFIPNSTVLQAPIVNWTRTPTRRTTLVVGVAYDTPLDEAKEVLIAATRAAGGVDLGHPPEAFVEEFAESRIDIAVRFWHRSENIEMWRTRDHVATAVKRALDAAGITIAFPQRTLWFGPGNTELSVRNGGSDDGGSDD